MHKGVDFAAPTGTPIMAAGTGVVRKARWFGSFGKYVRIAHANGYETAYAHLSRIAPGVREGARVRQGQIIGRVGTTGRSTGPHLHYEVMAGKRQINPMGVKLPTGTTLAGAELDGFRAHVARVNAVLDKWGETPALVAEGEVLRAKLSP
jgi:murein DD-endopeptidase MepM/ murein hydrolase activator NlpD